MTNQSAISIVGEFVANRHYDDLSDLAITRARQVTLDFIGTMLGGYQTRLGALAADYAAQMQKGDDASIVGDGRRSALEGAAWANATMGKYLGMDDSHRTAGHVASQLVPVALTLGEQLGLSGQQYILALAVGYDVMDLVHSAVDSWQRERGMDHKSQAGTFGSAATAAKAMGLSADKTKNALALAMDMACGTEQYVWDAGSCDTKDLLAGYGARNGIYAAKLADFGFRGPPGALDGEYGYFHAFGPGYDEAFLDVLDGEALARTGFKPHAGCRHVHSCVDATHELLKSGRPDLNSISSIEVDTYLEAITPEFRVNYEPQVVGQAGFSLPVTVSVILTRGNWFREDIATFDEPEQKRLRQLVKVGLDEKIQASHPLTNGCEVRIKTDDGALYKGRVEYAKGEPENMLTDAEFEEKFRYLVGDMLPPDQIASILERCGQLEHLADVGELVRLTVPQPEMALK
ncbi:MAG: MmgE/PrpD family protein [Chloroflexota bacterium]|nr:MmgE/PrpD family protein [Chloroflexota bacterium]